MLLTDVTDDFEEPGYQLQHLGDIFAELAQGAAAARAATALDDFS